MATLFDGFKRKLADTWSPASTPWPTARFHVRADSSDSTGGRPMSVWDFLTSKIFLRLLLIAVGLLLLGDIALQTSSDAHRWITLPIEQVDSLEDVIEHKDIDWSQFAYCQYVTTDPYLCNSLMIFESLKRVGAKADRVMLYPRDWKVDDEPEDAIAERRSRLLRQARDKYGVKLVPIKVQHLKSGDITWADSFTKLLAFNQTQYQRVLALDSDATVLKPMDELFLLPPAAVAMPRGYWLEDIELSSQVVLVQPSTFEFGRIEAAMKDRHKSDYDMEIINNLYGRDCLILPHRKYDLITGEFGREPDDHGDYLGSWEEDWDPQGALDEAKFVHFSDWPLPKPWNAHNELQWKEVMPTCHTDAAGKKNCDDQKVWKSLYADFGKRREEVCGLEFMNVRS